MDTANPQPTAASSRPANGNTGQNPWAVNQSAPPRVTALIEPMNQQAPRRLSEALGPITNVVSWVWLNLGSASGSIRFSARGL